MSFLGVIIGIGAIITASLIEGGNPLALIDIPAVFIVLGVSLQGHHPGAQGHQVALRASLI